MKRIFQFLSGATLLVYPALAQDSVETTELPSIERSYAQDNGISVDEAREHLALMREAGILAGKLRAMESDTFGGLYADRANGLEFIFLFTEAGDATLKKYKAPKGSKAVKSEKTEKSLYKEQDDITKILRANGAEVASQSNIRTGEIEVFSTDPAAVDTAAKKAGLVLPDLVKVKKVNKVRSTGEAAIYAGYQLRSGTSNACTAGFAVSGNSTATAANRYLTTAGHCPNTLNYAGSNLPFWFEWWAANNVHDFQVHTLNGNTVSNSIYVGSSTLQSITSVWPYSNMFVDDYACKYGRVTTTTCGYVVDLNYSGLGAGGFVRMHRDGVNLSEGGDSGGPWYNSSYNEAWGVHSDSVPFAEDDAFFMPVSRFEEAGLRVITK